MVLKKVVSILIVFVMMFTYSGQTLKALAATEGVTTITNGFFGNSNVVFKSYFEEEEQAQEKIIDVNEKATLILEISPKDIGEGFIKEGMISAHNVSEGNLSFKFSRILGVTELEGNEELEENSEGEDITQGDLEENNEMTNEIEKDEREENIEDTDKGQEEEQDEEKQEVEDEENLDETKEEENKNDDIEIEEQRENNEIENPEENAEDEEELIDENQIVQEMLDTEDDEEELVEHPIEIISDNEIAVRSIINKTKVEVEIEYVEKEKMNEADLYQEIEIGFSGKYVDANLREKEETANSNIVVGWKYHKDIEVTSEYTKFSKYEVGERKGSILENKVTVKREADDEKYLPLKNITIEIAVPMVDEEVPDAIRVVANKLMASKGQDAGNIEFSDDNWEYNQEKQEIVITINNDEGTNTLGVDEYVIIYQYNHFAEGENYTFSKKVNVNAEEYSGSENQVLNQKLEEEQEITAVIGDMVSYSISTDDQAIGKGKINGNYNSENAIYETEFGTTVNLNILTDDSYEEVTIDGTRESYFDAKQTEFANNDVYYKKVKFVYHEIENILHSNGVIEIYNAGRELLYTLNEENVQSQENCEIELGGNPNGIFVVLKNVGITPNIKIEFTKAIGKSNYDKATFNTFREIESKVIATVKYADDENIYSLSELAVRKQLENSYTKANFVLTNNNLSTVSRNKNVEMKIELNNSSLDSDLYTNPSFEMVFPEYVKDVNIQDVSLMYAEGLTIGNYQTYVENDIVKMRVDLVGSQTVFNESEMTNGTNILITADILLDEYTPAKKDYITMYYVNEAVTNYTSQTKWTMNKEIPAGIVRETNGFEAAVVNYVAPSGLVTANSILNYDGQGGILKSIKQGNKIGKIEREIESRIATMELFVANNTGSTCSNVVLMGNIPFENNRNVMTNEALGTNVNSKMISGIEANNQNPNHATIYYSAEENPSKDLEDSNNGWVENPDSLENVKSYMIVVNEILEPEAVLKYNYQFEIPENLNYDTVIYGSFGSYYDAQNESSSTVADLVGLQTEVSLPVEIKVTSDIAENVGVGEGRFINYTVAVTSKTDATLYNIKLHNDVPEGTTYYRADENDETGENLVASNAPYLEWVIEELGARETYTQEYTVKVNGGMEGKTVKNSVTAVSGDMENKSNTCELDVFGSIFSIEVDKSADFVMVGDNIMYTVKVTNISGKDAKNVNLLYDVPDELELTAIKDADGELEYQTGNGQNRVIHTISELSANDSKTFYIEQTAKKENKTGITVKINFELENGTLETSPELNFKIGSYDIEVVQTTNLVENKVQAGEEMELILEIENKGNIYLSELQLENMLSEYIEPNSIFVKSETSSYSTPFEEEHFEKNVNVAAKSTTRIVLTVKVKEDAVGKKIKNQWKLESEEIGKIDTDELTIEVVEPVNDESNESDESISVGSYGISGMIWLDKNNNGIKDMEEETAPVELQLIQDGEIVKIVNTNSAGKYVFSGLTEGKYVVVANYDAETYGATTYSAENTDGIYSNAFETAEGTAVTDTIVIAGGNVENVNIGLIEKEKFDLALSQSIVKATVVAGNKEKVYEYDDLDLAKLKLSSKELQEANVKMEYKMKVANVGNVNGKVSSIVNYLSNDMNFVESDNPDWKLGADGNLYYTGLKDTTIGVGEEKEVSLVLEKQLSESNTGNIVSNRAQIVKTESQTRIRETKSNNFASQETIITNKSGANKLAIVTGIIFVAAIATFGYMVQTGKITLKRIYR